MMMAGPISLFRQRYPGVELKISEFGGLTVQQAVTNGELDVAMTALPLRKRAVWRRCRSSATRCACWCRAPATG
jgi:DNA-binding transcriptional LysR family regulator